MVDTETGVPERVEERPPMDVEIIDIATPSPPRDQKAAKIAKLQLELVRLQELVAKRKSMKSMGNSTELMHFFPFFHIKLYIERCAAFEKIDGLFPIHPNSPAQPG